MPRCPDLAIFVLIDDDDNDRQTQQITLPLAHARGVIMLYVALLKRTP